MPYRHGYPLKQLQFESMNGFSDCTKVDFFTIITNTLEVKK